ncbi:MAG TPA: glutaminyl-peptide cyclotransferase, partial [Flavobacterium sp.]|uniref:glutaminyl-peptide cyclotransferase n=1 Tax=Flavobacterium sp. TaxID=239 RepID=UPI002ED184BA
QQKTGFIYNAKTLKLEKSFSYDKEIEGWGMTNDGKYIYRSDGTEKIWKMDPATQKLIDYINVYSGNSKIKAINELELIDGKFYVNVWQKDAIAVVNPISGAVEGILDMSGLRKLTSGITTEDVLNGIAYNPKTKTIFVTGKNWNKMFEITVSE